VGNDRRWSWKRAAARDESKLSLLGLAIACLNFSLSPSGRQWLTGKQRKVGWTPSDVGRSCTPYPRALARQQLLMQMVSATFSVEGTHPNSSFQDATRPLKPQATAPGIHRRPHTPSSTQQCLCHEPHACVRACERGYTTVCNAALVLSPPAATYRVCPNEAVLQVSLTDSVIEPDIPVDKSRAQRLFTFRHPTRTPPNDE
jgi:hypothetical protein